MTFSELGLDGVNKWNSSRVRTFISVIFIVIAICDISWQRFIVF